MRSNHLVHACQRGCASSTAEIYDGELAKKLKAYPLLEELARSNLADLSRLCHRALAGRGSISKCVLLPDRWSITLQAVKSRSVWYAPGQDPYEVFKGRVLGNHGSFDMLDESAGIGTPVSIALDHELSIDFDFKINYRRAQDNLLLAL